MKRLWYAVALLLAVALISGYGFFTVNRHLKQLSNTCSQLYHAAEKKEEAVELAQAFAEQWQDSQKTLSVWLSHTHVEEVNEQIFLLLYFANQGNADSICRSCNTCLVFFEDMRRAQFPLPENIF